jgi:hypothetical protein
VRYALCKYDLLTFPKDVADKYNLIPPVADQCLYNAFNRDRVEKEYKVRLSQLAGTSLQVVD